jgi:hypothetical protein
MLHPKCTTPDGHTVQYLKAGETYELPDTAGRAIIAQGFGTEVKPNDIVDK